MSVMLCILLDISLPMLTLVVAANAARMRAMTGDAPVRLVRVLCLVVWAVGIYWFVGVPYVQAWVMVYEAIAWALLGAACAAWWMAASPQAQAAPPPNVYPKINGQFRPQSTTHTVRRTYRLRTRRPK